MKNKEPTSIKALTQAARPYPNSSRSAMNTPILGPQTFLPDCLPLDDLMDTQSGDPQNQPTPTPTTSPLPSMLYPASPALLSQIQGPPSTSNLLLAQDPSGSTTGTSSVNPNSDLTASIHAPKPSTENPNTTQLTPPAYTPTAEEQAILDHLALAEENRAVTRDNGRNHLTTLPQFTPVPLGGFPHSHPSHSAQIFDFLDNQVLMSWFQVEKPKFIVRVFDHTGKDVAENAALLTERIRTNITIIAKFIQQDAPPVRVSPPHATGGKENKDLPLCFLVHNISPETYDTILSQRIWSASDITFEAFHFNCSTPPYLLFCLNGFTTHEKDTVVKAVADVWAHDDNRAEIGDFLSIGGEIPEEKIHTATYSLIRSIYVEHLDFRVSGGIAVPRFNIFARSPTQNAEAWTKLRSFLRILTYPTGLDGCGAAVAVSPCPLCHSTAHPRGLCPFPGIPLWNGPKTGNRSVNNATKNKGKGKFNRT